MPGKLHPPSPKRLPVPGKHEKGKELKQKLFEEGAEHGLELGSGYFPFRKK